MGFNMDNKHVWHKGKVYRYTVKKIFNCISSGDVLSFVFVLEQLASSVI